MTFIGLTKPLKKEPSLCLERNDIKIISEHYGYDYGDCQIICNKGRQICIRGSCLIDKETRDVIDDIPNWRKDLELIKKFYEYDKRQDFTECKSFEEYLQKWILKL